jgi:hypothetical protein
MIQRLLSSRPVLRIAEVLDCRTEHRMSEFGMLAQALEFAKLNVIWELLEFWRAARQDVQLDPRDGASATISAT